MARDDRDILQRAVRTLSEQAAKADALVDEALAAGLNGSHPLTIQAKMLRLELLNVKADLERNLGQLVLDCSDCGRTVHWVAGLGTTPGHWAHREPVHTASQRSSRGPPVAARTSMSMSARPFLIRPDKAG
jgi:hypothetical protein